MVDPVAGRAGVSRDRLTNVQKLRGLSGFCTNCTWYMHNCAVSLGAWKLLPLMHAGFRCVNPTPALRAGADRKPGLPTVNPGCRT
jgi:hypothetical protein